MRSTVATSWRTLENVEVECTHCGVRMTQHQGSGNAVRYFRCASCRRFISSSHTDILRADSKMRTHAVRPAQEVVPMASVKARLERFLAAVEDQDPYRVLGVSPLDSAERVRTRYRELALQCHPDRGGTPERMREVNAAYERILSHRERRQRESLPANVRLGALPAA
ncbi:MAG: J domain-containing protein [Myxococcaceae bacterium]|nr:J domain-containing protein [Myxococcaceae bacterium]